MSNKDNSSTGEHYRNKPNLRDLGTEIIRLVEPKDEPGLYSIDKVIADGSKVALAVLVDQYPSESEIRVSELVAGKNSLQRQTYRWSLAFPDAADRQYYQSVNSGAEDKRDFRTELNNMDLENINRLIYSLEEALRHNG